MNGALHPEPLPGLIARELPRTEVTIYDPSGQHRFFKMRRQGVRFGVNTLHGITWTICVTVDGQDYVVPPSFVRDAEGNAVSFAPPNATVIQFPAGSRRGGAK